MNITVKETMRMLYDINYIDPIIIKKSNCEEIEVFNFVVPEELENKIVMASYVNTNGKLLLRIES